MIEIMDQPEVNMPGPTLSSETQVPPVSPVVPAQQAAESFLAQDNAKSKPPFLKIFLFILVLVILIVIGFLVYKFVLPNFTQIGKSQETTLTYWGLWEPDNVMRQVFDEYEKSHKGIKINYVFSSLITIYAVFGACLS